MITEKIVKVPTIVDKIESVDILPEYTTLPTWIVVSKISSDGLNYAVYADQHGLHIGYMTTNCPLY